MASVQRILAAVAAIVIAFVFVMLVQALSPDPGVHEGAGEVRFERFVFAEQEVTFTEGSIATLQNAGGVPVTFIVTDPQDENVSIRVGPGGSTNVTLALEGTYTVTTEEWPWAASDWIVRDANPFVRFFEDLF